MQVMTDDNDYDDDDDDVQPHCHESVGCEHVNTSLCEATEDFTVVSVEKFKARKTLEPKLELELFKPESLLAKNPFTFVRYNNTISGVIILYPPFTFVRKALLPKIKYHWDQGFAQVSCH